MTATWPAGAALLLVVVSAHAWYSRHAAQSPLPGKPASAVAAHDLTEVSAQLKSTISPPARYRGTVVAEREVTLSSPQDGRVQEISNRLGDAVKEGDVLVQLDSNQQLAQLAIATAVEGTALAEVRRAEVVVAVSEATVLRSDAKVGAGVMPGEALANVQAEHSMALSSLAIARARVLEARARVGAAKADLERMLVRAPFAGTIVARYVDPGASVTAQAMLVRLVGNGPSFLRFGVPAEAAPDFARGAKVTARIADTNNEAQVSRSAPEIDPATGMVVVEAHFLAAGSPERLPGEPAWVALEGAEQR